MVVLQRDQIDIAKIRSYVARPQKVSGPLPAVIAYSDIFGLTPPHLRMVDRIASYGFLVVAPELYSKIEPPGTVFDFDRDRQRALDDAAKVQAEWIDAERRALMDWLTANEDVDASHVAVCGWCFGGHLAFRAAVEREVVATACFYATGLQADQYQTLARVAEIRGSLLLVWGTADPHIPEEGRRRIHGALSGAGVRFEVRLFDAEHAFMRDVGPRWDPEAADGAFAQMIDRFRRSA